jgi:hypothetical protein
MKWDGQGNSVKEGSKCRKFQMIVDFRNVTKDNKISRMTVENGTRKKKEWPVVSSEHILIRAD